MKNQVYGYIRVSTIRQGLKGVSLQEQKSAIDKYAANNGLTIARWFEEKETAAKQGRPVFSQMLKLLQKGVTSGVIIHKIDRSARNLKDWAALGELIDNGINVHFAHESVDLNARGGRLSADIQAVIATDYIRNLREETIKGMYGRLKQGFYPFGAPLGYLNHGSAKPKTPDPLNAPLIKEAFQIYATGEYSLIQLQRYLTEKGLRNRSGGMISINALSCILHNPFYMGIIYIKKNQETFKGNHESIISKNLFDRVQNVLEGKSKKGSGKHQLMFRRLFKCKACNFSVIGERQKGHVYYRCHSQECKGTCVREESIENAMKATLINLKFTKSEEKEIDNVLEELMDENDSIKKKELKRLKMQEGKISARLEILTDKYIDGDLEKEDFLRRKKSCLVELKNIEQKIFDWENDKAITFQSMIQKLELLKSLYSGYIQANESQKRKMVKLYTSNRLIDVKNVLLELKTPFRELAEVFNFSLSIPGRIRTCDLELRRLPLCPTELPGHKLKRSSKKEYQENYLKSKDVIGWFFRCPPCPHLQLVVQHCLHHQFQPDHLPNSEDLRHQSPKIILFGL